MAGWKDNAIMTWNGQKVTDHGRSPLTQSTERIGIDRRMADGTLRRQFVGIKRKWNVNWENIPSTNDAANGMRTADGGMAGEDIEQFYFETPGKFRLVLRRGSAINKVAPNPPESALPYEDDDFYITNVMLSDFGKEVRKRGTSDLWSISVSLDEV
jgi:hypothetical protein